MKKLFLLLAISVTTMISFAQQVISNAEDTGTGWWPAGSAGAVDLWDNPLKDAVNSTNKAITVWINNADDAWTGGGIGGLNIDVSTYNTISVLVFKQVAGTVRLELQDGVGPNQFVSQSYTTPGAWQKLEYTIPSGMGNITTLLVAPFIDKEVTLVGEQSRMWWDEVIAFNKNNTATGMIISDNDNSIVKYDIYSLSGSLIKTVKNCSEFSNLNIQKGFYLVKKTDDKGNAKCEKTFINK